MKLLEITDEVNTCELCGKTNLKCTAALENEEGGIVYYGRDCAGKTLYGAKSRKNTDQIDRVGRAISYAKKWIAARPELANDLKYLNQIVDRMRILTSLATIVSGKIHVIGVGDVS